MNTPTYSLGTNDEEQKRLHRQRELYGDTVNLHFPETATVCEIGSGAGANLWIAQQTRRGRYIGIDAEAKQNKAAARHANALGLTNVELHTAPGHRTGLDSASVDIAFCRCVLIHQPDPAPLVDEMYRITRPGGRIIIIEPHDASYYCGPHKPYLMKCFRARARHVYGFGRGSPEVALNLYSLLTNRGVGQLRVTPHVITVTGREYDRCKAFLNNWAQIIATVSSDLLGANVISRRDLKLAQEEAGTVAPETFICQIMWIAEATK
ncbi:MAG: class I SAM-dependent methyltransferase [Acidiferrobacterales bacterium]